MNSNDKKLKILRPVVIAVLAMALVSGAGMGTAWAYFTTYATMKGGVTLSLGDTTEIFEDAKGNKKTITITTDPTSQPVYVRAKAFSGDDFGLTYSAPEGGWSENTNDGYWYYDEILAPAVDEKTGEPKKGSTTPLTVEISRKIVEGEEIQEGDSFNIVVIYETVPVTYDKQGNPETPKWDGEDSKVRKWGGD